MAHAARYAAVALTSLLLACEGPSTDPGDGIERSLAIGAEAETGVFLFHDCVGPAGTQTSFTAEKIELPLVAVPTFAQSTAYRLTDGSAIFFALIRGDRHHPPGIDPSGIATTTCLVNIPVLGTLLFSGFLALTSQP